MAFILWTDKYSTNIQEIDTQHKHLFSLLCKLHDAVSEGAEQGTIADILDELVDYTFYHFRIEEDLLKKKIYPDYENHKKQHDKLTGQAVELQNRFREGSATISFEILDFLRDWLDKHTLVSDLKYADFIMKNKTPGIS
ncbi:Bacteriaohemerythrin [Desulfonema limicola]|uniref:Bacteriaohemerythrin n=1 Tax=Desulfonema limicola TaxID=45656 RepID=A0A975BEF0_9BACT|nr:bacteriohemerythrin [Desulfonema limicola]QTA83590.1 Bacteriaohemerythrin [Desulfonema limicola]